MSELRILLPPEIVDNEEPIIFLAGPIQGAPNWQPEAARLIHRIDPAIVIASPRKNYAQDEFIYEKQVDWETHFLRNASRLGVIAFWLAVQTSETSGRSYAQTTRFELAEWKRNHEVDGTKIALGIEPGFGNERYIRRRFLQDSPDVVIADNLPELCENAVGLL